MATIDKMRKDIGDWICDAQTSDSYFIGKAEIHWVSGFQEFLLKLNDGEADIYDNDGYGLVNLIDDEDILEFYPEIAEYYEEAAE